MALWAAHLRERPNPAKLQSDARLKPKCSRIEKQRRIAKADDKIPLRWYFGFQETTMVDVVEFFLEAVPGSVKGAH